VRTLDNDITPELANAAARFGLPADTMESIRAEEARLARKVYDRDMPDVLRDRQYVLHTLTEGLLDLRDEICGEPSLIQDTIMTSLGPHPDSPEWPDFVSAALGIDLY